MRRALLACVFLLVFLANSTAPAADISLPMGAFYRPGCYVPLRIKSDGIERIEIRGEGIVGIDYSSAGKSEVDVPLLILGRPSSVELLLNGQPHRFSLDASQPAPGNDSFPGLLSDSLHNPSIRALQLGGYDNSVYDAVESWAPGRPASQRRWILLAGAFSVLLLGVIGFWRSRLMPWIAVAMGLGLALVFSLRPELTRAESRKVLVVRRDRVDQWQFYTSRRSTSLRVPIPDSADFRVIPADEGHFGLIAPVLEVEATGAPRAMRVTLEPRVRVCFLWRGAPMESAGDEVPAPDAFVRAQYLSASVK